MATYKDDLDILKAAEKADTNKLTFNAITELDNKGLLSRYGSEGGSGSVDWDFLAMIKPLGQDTFDLQLLAGDYQTYRTKMLNNEKYVIGGLVDLSPLGTNMVLSPEVSPGGYTDDYVLITGAMTNFGTFSLKWYPDNHLELMRSTSNSNDPQVS